MEIQMDKNVCEQIQSLTSIRLGRQEYEFFADWLILVGVSTVRLALDRHPDLTLGDLVMLQFREDRH